MAGSEDVTVFHYKDAAGRDVLTNDPHGLPANAEIVDTSARPPAKPAASPGAAKAASTAASALAFPIDAGSALVGGAVGFGLGFLVALLLARRAYDVTLGARFPWRVVLFAAGVVVVGALYLGFVLRSAGLSDAAVATPGDAIEQAKQAAAAANRATAAQQRALEQLGR